MWNDALAGRRIIVTGGAAGLGYFTSERLAAAGARVVLTARSLERGARAAASIRELVPGARVDVVELDLADLASVARAARELAAHPVDGLIANAGVLPWDRPPATRDGFEPAFGTNHLGHFALLAQLHHALTHDAGIVSLGSLSAIGLRLRFDDLMHERRRTPPYLVYGRSKLAVMTFAVELHRRIVASARPGIRSVIAHPGYATDAHSPRRPGITEDSTAAFRMLVRGFAHSKDSGAAISIAALARGRGGELWGPGAWHRLGGEPVVQPLRGPVLDPTAGRRLWEVSEALTGVEFRIPPA